MEKVKVSLPYGKGMVEAAVPSKNLLAIATPKEVPGAADEGAEVLRAIRNPIGSGRLDQMVKKDSKVLILTTNWLRLMPNKHVPPIVEELNRIGVNDDNITILSANGLNPKNPDQETRERLVSKEILERIEFIEHDPEDSSGLKDHGKKTSYGTKIIANKLLEESDFTITTGWIELHPQAGYGGGRKNVLPGTGASEPVMQNHMLAMKPGSESGQLDGNPMSEDMYEFTRTVGLDFFVNSVFNMEKKIVKTFAGDYDLAFREGIKLLDSIYKVYLPAPADIAIACSGGFPLDDNMRQAAKGWDHARSSLKPGGIMIAVAQLPNRFGNLPLFHKIMKESKDLNEVEKTLKTGPFYGNWNIYMLLKVLKSHEIILVSDMSDSMVEDAFMTPAKSVEEALELAFKKLGGEKKVVVIPKGDFTLPIAKAS